MPDYSNGKVYKLMCDTTKKFYIGSTTLRLCQRLAQHKRDFIAYSQNKKRYSTSYEILENGNYQIVLLENVKCNNREELLQRERFYIENMECVNRCIPIRGKTEKKELHKISNQQYEEKNKESIKERKQNYYQSKKEYILERCKNYRNTKEKVKINCVCGSCYLKSNKCNHLKTMKHINFINNNNNNI